MMIMMIIVNLRMVAGQISHCQAGGYATTAEALVLNQHLGSVFPKLLIIGIVAVHKVNLAVLAAVGEKERQYQIPHRQQT